MSTKDPYDFIKWNPQNDRNMMVTLKQVGEKEWRNKHNGKFRKQWMGYIYDLIVLCTVAATLATLLNLMLNWR